MTYLPQLNQVVQLGRGIASSVLGLTYSVYRLNSASTGSVVGSQSLVYPAYQMYFNKAQKTKLENETFNLLAFAATCDGTKLRVGDILVENGYESDGGMYCVVQLRPMKQNMIIRVEMASAIERPHPAAGAAENQPTSGAVAMPLYGGLTPANRYEVTLNNGLYNVLEQGIGAVASIPIGLQPINRVKDGHKPDLPTVIPRSHFIAYIPPTPGYMPSELDVIKGVNQDSYEIQQVYSSSPVGISGNIVIVEKLAA